ncbi:MAG TPA: TIGR02253 family HAD-type hydrolase [Candidatus Acidoferrales bacterium]|nr:TIGR02253 family HAD-type hydrolase [Candidatus Acidoferrales bacterium]
MIKAVVFDLDNTLVDFMKMKGEAIDAAIRAMIDAGLDLSYDEVKKRIDAIYKEKGIEFQYVFDSLLSDIFDKVDYKILSAGVVAYRRAREAALVPYPHVNMTLYELLKMGMKLAVVSDAPAREAWLRLTYLNMHNIFDVVVTFEDTNERKPHPAPFTLALKKLGVKAVEALMVGDWAERDIIGAKKVGMKTVFARYGDTFDTVISGGDYEANDIQELVGIIKRENSGG